MTSSAPRRITQLLLEFSSGQQAAMKELVPLVYQEMRVLAERALWRERRDHTLGTTALVHEAYLRLVDQHDVRWEHRAQFFGIAAQMMRRILVDHARSRAARKRGGTRRQISLDEVAPAMNAELDLIGLDEALERLSGLDPQQGRVVELRFFGGLTIEETAELLGISPATVKREWTLAKAWLRREMTGERDASGTRPST